MTFPLAFSYPWYLLLLLALPVVIGLWWRGRGPGKRQISVYAVRSRRVRDILSLALRVLLLSLLVFSLAGLQWVRASDELAVVFLLDVSDSVDIHAREQALRFIRAALAGMGPDDRAALVLFGSDALVERPLSQARELGELLSIPATGHTDIGQAVRLGLALLPSTAQRRLVLLSDGQANVLGAETAAQLARAGGVDLHVVSLPARGGDETWVDTVQVPSVLYEGEQFSVVVRVRSTVEQRALLRLFADGNLLREELVLLNPGLNSFLFDLLASESGFSTFAIQLVPEKDMFYQNNFLGAFAMVRGAPRVLLVARDPYPDEASGQTVDDAEALRKALESAGLSVERVSPAYMPGDLASLGEWAAVVLVNVPASGLAPRQMDLLQAYVRDLGRGLVCVGGEESYGVGGYFKTPLEETLPVEMTIKDKVRMPPLAIVFAVDKSGSMDMAASPGGPRKVDLVKEAVIRSLELLNPGDQVGVVAFEDSAQWVWKLAPLEDVTAIQNQVMTMRGGGGTDIHAGLGAAVQALEGSDAHLKHVILLTDGGASQEGLRDLALRLRAMDGTLSTVGVGQDSADFLRPLATDGGGRYHYTDNPATIPQIFAQETTMAQRAYIVEETFYPSLAGPSPILDGIEAVPALYGYVATSSKPLAQAILVSGQDDPILVQWQYGLGRAVAWMSDAKGKWARAWVSWEQFPRFWAQAVRWVVVERQESGIETQINDDGERARIQVDVVGEGGEYGNNLAMEAHLISPTLISETVTLRQTAPGHYEGAFWPEEEGVYLVQVRGTPKGGGQEDTTADGDRPANELYPPEPVSQVTGFVRTYSPEYRTFGTDESMLRRLAEAGGGRVLTDPAAVFVHDQDPVRTYSDVWPWLMGVALCLLPLDIGVRRVTVNLSDLRRAWAKARARLRRRPARRQQPSEGRMSRLMSAKAVARKRVLVEPGDVPSVGEMPVQADRVYLPDEPALPSPPSARPEPLEPEATQDVGPADAAMTSRLLAAKKRAVAKEQAAAKRRDGQQE